jgi:hypothetical protein
MAFAQTIQSYLETTAMPGEMLCQAKYTNATNGTIGAACLMGPPWEDSARLGRRVCLQKRPGARACNYSLPFAASIDFLRSSMSLSTLALCESIAWAD